MTFLKLILWVCFVMVTALPVPDKVLSEELVIVGTGAGVPVLKAVGKAFTRMHPDVTVIVPPSIGTGGGIKAVGKDEYLLGRVARDIKEKEKRYGLTQRPLAKLPIVFYTNVSVSLDSITPEQACSIYSGKIRRWEDLKGGNGPIRVIRRETGDSSLKVLLDTLPGFEGIIQTRVAKVTYTDQETVALCSHRENSIAYGTLADVKDNPKVHLLKLSGVSPSAPGYPCFGPLDLVYKTENYHGTLKAFVEFVSSDAAKSAVIEAGGVPAD